MASEIEDAAAKPNRRSSRAAAAPKGSAKPAAGKLTRPVSFRLTDADHAAYLAKVETSGLKPSAFFRDAVLTNKTQILARPKASPDRGRMLYLFNKASNNINQLAHRANADHMAGVISERTYGDILDSLDGLVRSMKAVLKDGG